MVQAGQDESVTACSRLSRQVARNGNAYESEESDVEGFHDFRTNLNVERERRAANSITGSVFFCRLKYTKVTDLHWKQVLEL